MSYFKQMSKSLYEDYANVFSTLISFVKSNNGREFKVSWNRSDSTKMKSEITALIDTCHLDAESFEVSLRPQNANFKCNTEVSVIILDEDGRIHDYGMLINLAKGKLINYEGTLKNKNNQMILNHFGINYEIPTNEK